MLKKFSFGLAVLALAVFSINAYSESISAKIDEDAPNFTLSDSYGNKHNLADFKGKHVVLEWVNFDCPFVKKHYDSKNLQELQKKYTEKGVVWLGICSSAPGKQGNFNSEDINNRVKNNGAAYTAYLIDEDGSVGKMYGAKTTPHMYIITPDGKLAYAGAIDDNPSANKEDAKTAKNFISANLDLLLAGKQCEVKTNKSYGCSVKYN